MVNIISQETFNEAVVENMSLLDIDAAEAVEVTVEQFLSQGVDLSNIIKDETYVIGNKDPLAEALEGISISQDSEDNHFNTIIELCTKDISFKLKAAELGAYQKILSFLKKCKESSDDKGFCKSLDALCALMNGYPDLLEETGFELIVEIYSSEDKDHVLSKTLEWTRICCINHESNRKTFIDRNLHDSLSGLLEKKKDSSDVVGGVCKVAVALTLDDDIRDTVSNSHMHACILASTMLPSLVPLLDTSNDEETLCHVLNTVSSVLVRDTLCQSFVDLGGLERLLKILSNDPSVKIMTRGFNVLGCLAGHDQIKDSIIKAGLAPKIALSLIRGKGSLPFCRSVLSLVARLSLRSPTNCKALYDSGLGEAIIDIMKVYSSDKKIQSLSCLAIRNMVSRNKELRPKFLALEVETLLRQIPQKFPDLSDNSKAALLALDVNVKLKEEWTGLHGDIVKANQ